jgi:hypothetical protein
MPALRTNPANGIELFELERCQGSMVMALAAGVQQERPDEGQFGLDGLLKNQ